MPTPLTTSFSVSPTSPAAGTVVNVAVKIVNTSNHKVEIGPEVYVYEGAMSYSNPNVVRLSSEGVFLSKTGTPGATYEKSFEFQVPVDKPSGTLYTAHLRVLQNGGATFHDAPFTVQ